ncbi:MAG: M14 family zinc carboxypeptidase, partial [candidate division Zixibacteria bacterium]
KPFIAIALILIVSTAFVHAEQLSQVTVLSLDKSDFLEIHRLGMDVLGYKGDSLEMIANQAELDWFDSRGITYRIDIPDLQAYYRSKNKGNLTMGGFKTFSEIEQFLDSLAAAYPSLLTAKFSIGTTIEGRDIWAVKISDNPNVDEDESSVLYIGLTHAREPAASEVLMNFMNHLLSNYATDTAVANIIDNRELYFIPVFNADGYVWNEIIEPFGGGLWRKNRRPNGDSVTIGVDMNRNWGFKWGYDNMGSSPVMSGATYRGTGPFSEPENQAMRDFIISRDIKIIHNSHSYSNLELWPPGYDRVFSKYDDMFSTIADSMVQYNGYTPQIGWELYPTNGEADGWAWGDTILKPRIISFTAEVGSFVDGFWPSPSRIPALNAENIWPNLFLAKIADNPYKFSPPIPPTISAPETTVVSNYNVEWNLEDSINPSVSYKLYELTGKQTIIDSAEADNGHWLPEKFFLTNARQHSGISSWHTLNWNRANHWLLAQTPSLVQPDDTLKFWIWYAIETEWDYFYAQISTDGGYDYFNLPNNMTTNSNPNGTNLGNGITGTSGDWVQAKFDLAAYAGQQVIFRLTYFTDFSFTLDGVYIDDIENVDFFSTEALIESGITDTFYNFDSIPAGEYWYRLTATDAEDQESRLSELALVSVADAFIKGDANSDGEINLLDLVYLVDFIFRAGPAPDPLLAGDANCDDETNILDLTYLVDYVFRGGPKPDCT